MSPADVERFARESIPKEAIRKLVPGLEAAYSAAHRDVMSRFTHEGPRADALWANRRALVEELLIDIAEHLTEVMPESVSYELDRGGPFHRIGITFGQLKVSQIRTAGPDTDPPKALYRQECSQINGVYYRRGLFDEEGNDSPTIPCFGMLIHGGATLTNPDFVRIRLMESDGEKFALGELDLLEEYRRITKSDRGEDIADDVGPEWTGFGETGSA